LTGAGGADIFNHMVEHRGDQLDRVFAALSDPTRRAILARLRRGPATVGGLAEPFDMSLNAVSKHLRALERARLIRREIRGREHVCALDAAPLRAADVWMADYRAFWTRRLDALEAFLGAPPRRPRRGGRR
jgi:DNA-binding transcriptional ArsR family regulator